MTLSVGSYKNAIPSLSACWRQGSRKLSGIHDAYQWSLVQWKHLMGIMATKKNSHRDRIRCYRHKQHCCPTPLPLTETECWY